MSSLAEIGLAERSPAEIVLTTFSPDKRPYASVVGIRAVGESSVSLRIFTNTRTFRNLLQSRAAVVNVVRDVRLLASIALKEFPSFGKIVLEFKGPEHVNAPKLVKADARVEVEVEEVERAKISDEIGSSEVAYITARVKNIEIIKPSVHPFKRSEFFVIEAAILATRIKEAVKHGKDEVARKKFLELEKYVERCRRIAPQSSELDLMVKIKDLFKNEVGK
jgi:hypothetical protein